MGLKQLQPHPWDALDPDLKVGDKVKGKVVVMADYGAFIEIAPGVEGLIHVSEMSWSQHLRSAQDFMKVGDEVEAVILTLDREERKMSLGIKQLKPDPWEDIETKYAVGSRHHAKVRNFTNFGVFVEIEEGVDGSQTFLGRRKSNTRLNLLKSEPTSKFKYWKSIRKIVV